MVASLVVAILIVYGMTLIVVEGTIFNGLKNKLNEYISKLESILYPSNEIILKLIESSHKSIPKKLLDLYNELQSKIATTDGNHSQFGSLVKMFDDALGTISKNVIKYRKRFYFTRLTLWIAQKLKKLTGCMMCMGFWNGVILSFLCLVFHISICGIPVIILAVGSSSIIPAVILFGFLSSGFVWMLHNVVDVAYETKEYIKNKE